MNDLLDRLRVHGWRMTPQRQVVAELLAGDNVHLTADEVHARAVVELPGISRATVYNTLNELVSMGEVAEVAPDGRSKRYDPNVVHAHQHLLCTSCGNLEDVLATNIDELGIGELERSFAVHDVDIVFKGTCGPCQADPRSS